jgi:hypothetical protein
MNKTETIVAYSTVAVLCVVAMIIASSLLPEANEANKSLIVVTNYLFAGIMLVQLVNIVSEVRSKL